jgi:hypothetical protein
MNACIRTGSASFRHLLAINEGDAPMLARRFTIVCLMIMVFGMGMSILVAEKSRLGPIRAEGFSACNSGNSVGCSLRL